VAGNATSPSKLQNRQWIAGAALVAQTAFPDHHLCEHLRSCRLLAAHNRELHLKSKPSTLT
jgi:hypothetical protein